MNYNKIIDPSTNRLVSIYSKVGKKVLKNYFKYLQDGGSGQTDIDLHTIFVPNFVLIKNTYGIPVLNHTVIEPISMDEAGSLVLLTKSNIDEKEYVLKIEKVSNPNSQVYHEANVLNFIKSERGIPETEQLLKDKDFIKEGIPEIVFSSNGSPLIMYDIPNITPKIITRIIIEEKLDKSLSFMMKEKRFTLKEIKTIGNNYLMILQYIHASGYIHLDIKPQNLMIKEIDGIMKYFIIDFGISKKWYSEKYITGGGPKQFKINKLIHSGEGTGLYKSRNADKIIVESALIDSELNTKSVEELKSEAIKLNIDKEDLEFFANTKSDLQQFIRTEKLDGIYFSRNEDIESLAYVLIELILGILPWNALKHENPPLNRLQAKDNIIDFLKFIADENLRQALTIMITGRDNPPEFEPDYKLISKLLMS